MIILLLQELNSTFCLARYVNFFSWELDEPEHTELLSLSLSCIISEQQHKYWIATTVLRLKQSPSADQNYKWQIWNMSKNLRWLYECVFCGLKALRSRVVTGGFLVWIRRQARNVWMKETSGVFFSGLERSPCAAEAVVLICKLSFYRHQLFIACWSGLQKYFLKTHLIKFSLFSFVLQMYDCWWGKHTQRWLRKSIFQKNEPETSLHAFQINLSALCSTPMCLIGFDTRIILRPYYSWASHQLGRHMQFTAETVHDWLVFLSPPFAVCWFGRSRWVLGRRCRPSRWRTPSGRSGPSWWWCPRPWNIPGSKSWRGGSQSCSLETSTWWRTRATPCRSS